MKGQGIDELGTYRLLWLMVGRMKLQIQHVFIAKMTLIGLRTRFKNDPVKREKERG
jgi:hypothetical protein